jgi:hypothetical protein
MIIAVNKTARACRPRGRLKPFSLGRRRFIIAPCAHDARARGSFAAFG